MKKLEIIVREEKFAAVIEVLEDSGIGGVTVTDAVGFGRHRNGLQPKKKIDIYVDEFQLEKTVDLVRQVAATGVTGDGKIAIVALDNLIKIRTGEDGATAI
ncbi:MAG: P-II family nitrogen regulator [Candidatus Omnitrophica bacterium]|nr:P-II family nitrogen regulator [Candidatus Omnitrophota bacterium]MCB9719827.1 P-II family nitrogen regulator [Candidatus Omnitrophota bacterium]